MRVAACVAFRHADHAAQSCCIASWPHCCGPFSKAEPRSRGHARHGAHQHPGAGLQREAVDLGRLHARRAAHLRAPTPQEDIDAHGFMQGSLWQPHISCPQQTPRLVRLRSPTSSLNRDLLKGDAGLTVKARQLFCLRKQAPAQHTISQERSSRPAPERLSFAPHLLRQPEAELREQRGHGDVVHDDRQRAAQALPRSRGRAISAATTTGAGK